MKKIVFLPFLFLITVWGFAQEEIIGSDNMTGQYNMTLNLKVSGTDGGENLMDSTASKLVLSGRPVRLNLKGSNFRAAIQLTLFNNENKNLMLLAQSTVYCKGEQEHIFSTVKSIPISLGEKILFFPLGVLKSEDQDKYNCMLEIDVTQFQQPVSANP